MREVVISQTVKDKIDDLELFLKDQLKLSKEAARKRCDRMDELFESLGSVAEYPLCRFKKWQILGYRCVVFEKKLGIRLRGFRGWHYRQRCVAHLIIGRVELRIK